MLLSYAEEINKRVRDFFKKGYKSSNKRYDAINNVSKEREEKRKENYVSSLMCIYELKDDKNYYNLAQNVIKMKIDHRSGNCRHMAALSVYYLIADKLIKPDLIYIGRLKRPGDHAFCLVSTERMGEQVEFSSVSDLASSGSAPSWTIVDPWLNVACRANDYVTKVYQKLDKWTADGKRISWGGGKEGFPDWYVPNGEYREALVNAPLELTAYQS